MKTFEVTIEYQDRTSGPGTSAGKTRVEANTLPVAVGKAFREIWKGMDRKVRFDANKNGIVIRAITLGEAVEQKEVAAAKA